MPDVSSNDSGACTGDDNCIECAPEVEVSMPGTIAALEAQLAEAHAAHRMLTARCDELAGERDRGVVLAERVSGELHRLKAVARRTSGKPIALAGEVWMSLDAAHRDYRAPLRDGKTNHAVGCRAEQDGALGKCELCSLPATKVAGEYGLCDDCAEPLTSAEEAAAVEWIKSRRAEQDGVTG